MPEIVNNSFCLARVRCFSGGESGLINNLLLISVPRVRAAASKHFMDCFAVIGSFTAGNSEAYALLFR